MWGALQLFFPTVMSHLLGNTLKIAINLLVFYPCPLCCSAFTPSLESTWVERHPVMNPELIICRFPLISHSVFAVLLPRVNSSCRDVPTVAYGMLNAGPDGRPCAGEYSRLSTTIWNASVAPKALVWGCNGHSLEMPKTEPNSLDVQMAWRQWNLLII